MRRILVTALDVAGRSILGTGCFVLAVVGLLLLAFVILVALATVF